MSNFRVCLTELKGYQPAVGKPVIQPRRPNSRLDKVRHMFQKLDEGVVFEEGVTDEDTVD